MNPEAQGVDDLPRHVAIIMDGNGRWAHERSLPRSAGHRQGVQALRRTVRAAIEIGIKYLTIYSFSAENWSRPASEVNFLLSLLRRFIRQDVADIHAAGVRIRVIGERAGVDPDIAQMIEDCERLTAANTTMTLIVAFNYGSRQELVRATRRIAAGVAAGDIAAAAIDADMITRNLDLEDLPDPDLLIRTGGEQRLSNFLLWQCAYTEFVFVRRVLARFQQGDAAAGRFGLLFARPPLRRHRRAGAVAPRMSETPQASEAPAGATSKWRDLGVRSLAAAVMIPLALAVIWAGGFWFLAAITAMGLTMAYEWCRMVHNAATVQRILHAAAVVLVTTPIAGFLPWRFLPGVLAIIWGASIVAAWRAGRLTRWGLAGVPYVALPILALGLLRQGDWGLLAVLWIMIVVWAARYRRLFRRARHRRAEARRRRYRRRRPGRGWAAPSPPPCCSRW